MILQPLEHCLEFRSGAVHQFRIVRHSLLRIDVGAGHSDRRQVLRQLLSSAKDFSQEVSGFDFHLRHAGDDPRRAARPLPLLRSRWSTFRNRGPSSRGSATAAWQATARPSACSSGCGSSRASNRLPYIWSLDRIMIAGGHRRGGRADGQPFQFGDFRSRRPTLPWGFEFVRSAQVGGTSSPRRRCIPTQIYEALCYLATFGILCWLYYRPRHGAPPSGHAVRHRPDR